MVAGPDSPSLLLQPANAIRAALAKAGLAVSDLDIVEISEAFAAVGIASAADLGLATTWSTSTVGRSRRPSGRDERQPALTALHELRRRGSGTAAVSLCGGGGQG